MSGCGVRSQRRWDKQRGFKKNKNKIKTSLSRGFKGSCHIHEQLLKKVQSLPILFWVQPEVQKGSDGWLGSCCSLKKERKKKVPVPSDAFCPRSHGCSFRGGRHSPHSGEAATEASSSCSHGWGKQRAYLLCLKLQEGLSLEMQLIAQTGVWPEPQS